MSRLNVNVALAPGELEALLSMALRDCRLPAQQLRHLLRIAAQQQGLLPAQSLSESDALNASCQHSGMEGDKNHE